MSRIALVLACLLGLLWQQAVAQHVINRPDNMQTLGEAWQWAQSQSLAEDAAWVAYGFNTQLDERLQVSFSSWDDDFIRWNRASNRSWSGTWYFNNGGGWQNRYSISALQDGVQTAQQDFARPRELLFLLRLENSEVQAIHLVARDALVEWRGLPVFWLGEFAGDESFRHLLGLLPRFSGQSIQNTLIRTLALHRVAERESALFALLGDDSYAEFFPVILESLAIQKSAAVQEQLLRTAQDSNASLVARRVAISALSRYDDAETLALLTALADQGNPQLIRRESIESLALIPSDASLQVLEGVLRGEDNRSVVQEALRGLARYPQMYDRIVEVAETHSDAGIRESALELAAYMGRARAFSLLRNQFNEDPDRNVREEALRSLDAVPADQAVPFLIEVANNNAINVDLREEAVDTLSNFAPELVMADLQRLAWSDSSEDVRENAVKALGELDHNTVNDLLLEIARNHPSSHTRREAMDELQDRVL